MADKKELPLAMARVLVEYTDEDHWLSTKELTRILEDEYGLTAERRTIYANIDLLKEYGYDISTWQENGVGYYLKSHRFSPEEVNWMIGQIKSESPFPARRRKEKSRICRRVLNDRVFVAFSAEKIITSTSDNN